MTYKYDILLQNGMLVDPINRFEGVRDIGIRDGRIVAVEEHLSASGAEQVFDIRGQHVMPGIVDMHCHVSEWLGGACGHKMLALAGVTTALDMSGPVEGLLKLAGDCGTGLTLATINRLTPGYNIKSADPDRKELQGALDHALRSGCIGLKLMGGNYPLTPEATAEAIRLANEHRAYVAFHAATTQTGSHLTGFLEALSLTGDHCLHIAHVNSYCRGMIEPYMTETQKVIDALRANPHIRCEAYLSPYNGNNGKCIDGVPEASVIRNCLRMGGYEPTEAGYEKAILDGWANINVESGGEVTLQAGSDAVKYWKEKKTDTAVSFVVNPPQPRYWLTTAKRADGRFVVDAISTDGGGIPRNVILDHGLSFVRLKAMTLPEFVLKASVNPGRILGMNNKGMLSEGADADITVFNLESQKPYMSIGSGRVIMYRGYVCGKGCNILTTEQGAENVRAHGLNPVLTNIADSAFYNAYGY